MRHAVIWGRRRQGKSTLAMALAWAQQVRPVIIFDPCNQYARFPSNPDLERALEEDWPVIRIVPGDVLEDWESLMAILDGGEWTWRDYTLLIDEASMIQKPQSLNDSLARIIRQSPDDVHVIETLHRPSETHPTVRALASDAFFFQTYLQRDLQVIAGTYGQNVADQVAILGRYEVLHFWIAEGGAPQFRVWQDPQLWYVPIRPMEEKDEKEDD